MKLLDLVPFDVLVNLTGEWLEAPALCQLDTACCCDRREILLSVMRQNPLILKVCDDWEDTYSFMTWITSRELKVEKLKFFIHHHDFDGQLIFKSLIYSGVRSVAFAIDCCISRAEMIRIINSCPQLSCLPCSGMKTVISNSILKQIDFKIIQNLKSINFNTFFESEENEELSHESSESLDFIVKHCKNLEAVSFTERIIEYVLTIIQLVKSNPKIKYFHGEINSISLIENIFLHLNNAEFIVIECHEAGDIDHNKLFYSATEMIKNNKNLKQLSIIVDSSTSIEYVTSCHTQYKEKYEKYNHPEIVEIENNGKYLEFNSLSIAADDMISPFFRTVKDFNCIRLDTLYNNDTVLTIAQHNPQLNTIQLCQGEGNITTGLQLLLDNCKNLTDIDIQLSDQDQHILDTDLKLMFVRQLSLTDVDFSFFHSLSTETLCAFMLINTQLNFVSVVNCELVDEDKVEIFIVDKELNIDFRIYHH